MTELSARQQAILGLVIKEYGSTAGPVSSRALVESYGLDISSATVRNELARLEDLGYLTHPHTSAGRLPTTEGYRHFVGRLMGKTELPLEERRTIAHQFYQAQDDFEERMPLAASILARATAGAAVVTAPQAVESRFKHVQLISIQGRRVMLVLVLQGGTVKQQLLTLAEPTAQEALSEASDRLNQLCAGLHAEDIEARIQALPAFESDVANLVVRMMSRADASPRSNVYRDGLRQVLQMPEFAERRQAQGLVRFVEEPGFLDSILEDALSPEVGNVRVLIGGDDRWEELRTCSLVIARYGVSDLATGALGVVGPIRMLYSRTISAVQFVAALLTDLMYDTYVG
jgi:heat-inducible transcriptional repressor